MSGFISSIPIDETIVNYGVVSSGSITPNASAGKYHKITVGGDFTLNAPNINEGDDPEIFIFLNSCEDGLITFDSVYNIDNIRRKGTNIISYTYINGESFCYDHYSNLPVISELVYDIKGNDVDNGGTIGYDTINNDIYIAYRTASTSIAIDKIASNGTHTKEFKTISSILTTTYGLISLSFGDNCNILFIGDSNAIGDNGIAYIYHNIKTTPALHSTISAVNLNNGFGGGGAIAENGLVCIIGEPWHTYGVIYRYTRPNKTSTTWTKSSVVLVGWDVNGYNFGYSIDCNFDGSRIISVADYANLNPVKVYDWTGSAWSKVGGNIQVNNATPDLERTVNISSSGSIVCVHEELRSLSFFYKWNGSDNWEVFYEAKRDNGYIFTSWDDEAGCFVSFAASGVSIKVYKVR